MREDGATETRPINDVRRLVVKVGSSSLVDGSGVVSRARLRKIVRDVASAAQGGRACVLVSSCAITFGDNDRLAALVAIMIRADLLVQLSDVDGIYTKDPRRPGARLVPEVRDPLAVESGPASPLGSGGMASKLQAAGLATAAGIPT